MPAAAALEAVKDIQNFLAEVSNDWRQSINTIETLKDVKYAGMAHNQLASALENLKNIFSSMFSCTITYHLIGNYYCWLTLHSM